jgi:hypothetical protein
VITFPAASKPDLQAAVGYSSDQCIAPRVVADWTTRGVQLIHAYNNQGRESEEVTQILTDIMGNNDVTCRVVTSDIDYYSRPGDWVEVYHPDRGFLSLRLQDKYINNGILTLSLGKKQNSASAQFGEYLRGTVVDDANPRINTALSAASLLAGTASFSVSSDTYALGGVKVVFEATYVKVAATTINTTAFVILYVNGKAVPPGRLRVTTNSLSLKIDITDYCTMPGTNTVKTILQNSAGYSSPSYAYVNQYIKVKFFAP